MTDQFIAWLQGLGALSLTSGLILALAFVVAAFVFFPRTFLCLAAGGLYGLPAMPVVLVGSAAGNVLAFLAARYLFADRLQRRLNRYPHLRAIAKAIDSESWRIVALLRFASPVPSSVQNYFFGLTRIGLWPYTWATLAFNIPQIVLYVYLGAVGRSMLIDDASSWISRAIMVAGALCLAAIVFLIWRKARVALAALPVSA